MFKYYIFRNERVSTSIIEKAEEGWSIAELSDIKLDRKRIHKPTIHNVDKVYNIGYSHRKWATFITVPIDDDASLKSSSSNELKMMFAQM